MEITIHECQKINKKQRQEWEVWIVCGNQNIPVPIPIKLKKAIVLHYTFEVPNNAEFIDVFCGDKLRRSPVSLVLKRMEARKQINKTYESEWDSEYSDENSEENLCDEEDEYDYSS